MVTSLVFTFLGASIAVFIFLQDFINYEFGFSLGSRIWSEDNTGDVFFFMFVGFVAIPVLKKKTTSN